MLMQSDYLHPEHGVGKAWIPRVQPRAVLSVLRPVILELLELLLDFFEDVSAQSLLGVLTVLSLRLFDGFLFLGVVCPCVLWPPFINPGFAGVVASLFQIVESCLELLVEVWVGALDEGSTDV